MGNIPERLLALVDELADGKHTVFAKKCGITPTTFQNYINGRLPNSESLIRICSTYSVSITWILTGLGNKYLSDPALEKTGTDDVVILKQIALVRSFVDKDSALRINEKLRALEKLNPEAFKKIDGYLSGLIDGIKMSQADSASGGAPAEVAQKKERANG